MSPDDSQPRPAADRRPDRHEPGGVPGGGPRGGRPDRGLPRGRRVVRGLPAHRARVHRAQLRRRTRPRRRSRSTRSSPTSSAWSCPTPRTGSTRGSSPTSRRRRPAPGILGELLTAALGQNPMLWRTSPIGTELEGVVVRWLREALGLPDAFDGLLTDTASTSTLIAHRRRRARRPGSRRRRRASPARDGLRPAARLRLRRGAQLDREGVHDARAGAGGAGEDPHQRPLRDGRRRPASRDRRRTAPPGRTPDRDRGDRRHHVVDLGRPGAPPSPTSPSARASGSTSTAPTPAWSRCCPDRRAPFAGWERADSIVVNPHKWLFTPLDASLLLSRRMDQLRAAFSLVPEYLRTLDRVNPVLDYNEYQPQLGRRMRALKLWMQLRWFGLEGLRRRIRLPPRAWPSEFAGLGRRRPGLGAAGAGAVLHGLLPLPAGARSRAARTSPTSTRASTSSTPRLMDAVNRTGEVFLSHTRLARPVHDPDGHRQPAHGAAPRRARVGAASRRGRQARVAAGSHPPSQGGDRMSEPGRGPVLLPDPVGRPRRVRRAVPQEPLADPARADGRGPLHRASGWRRRASTATGLAGWDVMVSITYRDWAADPGAQRRRDRHAASTRTRRRSRPRSDAASSCSRRTGTWCSRSSRSVRREPLDERARLAAGRRGRCASVAGASERRLDRPCSHRRSTGTRPGRDGRARAMRERRVARGHRDVTGVRRWSAGRRAPGWPAHRVRAARYDASGASMTPSTATDVQDDRRRDPQRLEREPAGEHERRSRRAARRCTSGLATRRSSRRHVLDDPDEPVPVSRPRPRVPELIGGVGPHRPR